MDRYFKWNMFITSFIPLWISIIVGDIWNVVGNVMNNFELEDDICQNLYKIFKDNKVCIFVVIIIVVMMISSMISINRFIRDKSGNNEPPRAKIKRAERANKLSSEFLLAYILPMIAFDFTDFKSVVLFVIYFLMLAFLCIRNSNIYTNIWLELKGYKMFFCDLEVDRMGRKHIYTDCIAISQNNLVVKTENNMQYWDFDNYIYIDLREV